MKLSMYLGYKDDFRESVRPVADYEKAGLDLLWIGEAYTFDAFTQVGYVAAITERMEIGTGVVNVYSRTPALMAMCAAAADSASGGRFHLGLGPGGPQVIEGFHGLPFDKPMARTADYIKACRIIWRREPFEFQGAAVEAPLAAGSGSGLGKPLKLINHPVRANIPIWWASLRGKSVQATAELADGWMPIFFDPMKYEKVWGADVTAGLARRDPALGPLQISAGGLAAIGDEYVGSRRDDTLGLTRDWVALYVGGMGARKMNFYNEIARQYGYVDEAIEIQDLYLSGKKAEAAAALPMGLLEGINLVGPKSYVAEKIAAYREAGVTVLTVSTPPGEETKTIEALRDLLD